MQTGSYSVGSLAPNRFTRWCAFKSKPGFRRWIGPVQEAVLPHGSLFFGDMWGHVGTSVRKCQEYVPTEPTVTQQTKVSGSFFPGASSNSRMRIRIHSGDEHRLLLVLRVWAESKLQFRDCPGEASLLAFVTLISSWPLSLTRYLNVQSSVCSGHCGTGWFACLLQDPHSMARPQ